MGLAMAHGIVNDHQGIIKVNSNPDVGTTVEVYLPLSVETKVATATKVDEHCQPEEDGGV